MMATVILYNRRVWRTLESGMALKLISTLAILVLASFAYKVWDKTKVPEDVELEDVWKVKTIEFICRIVHKIMDLIVYFKGDVFGYGRPLLSFAFNTMHYGLWPMLGIYQSTNNSWVVTEQMDMDGVPVILHRNPHYRHVKSQAIMIYFHGGGWQFFNADDPGPTLRAMSQRLGIPCISVEYRLSPEYPYPAGLEDCIAVTQHVIDHHMQLGINPRKVIIAGDSAGGNLAASVALRFKKKIRLQVLIYPILQMFNFQTSSYTELNGKLKYILSANMVISSITSYGQLPSSNITSMAENKHLSTALQKSRYTQYVNSTLISSYVKTKSVNNRASSKKLAAKNKKLPTAVAIPSPLVQQRAVDPHFMPLMADNLDNSADAYIITAHNDILRDDGLLYHVRLSSTTGVRSLLKNYKDGFHTFFHFSQGPLQLNSASAALNELINYINDTVISENEFW